jgi:hypothetical protein
MNLGCRYQQIRIFEVEISGVGHMPRSPAMQASVDTDGSIHDRVAAVLRSYIIAACARQVSRSSPSEFHFLSWIDYEAKDKLLPINASPHIRLMDRDFRIKTPGLTSVVFWVCNNCPCLNTQQSRIESCDKSIAHEHVRQKARIGIWG